MLGWWVRGDFVATAPESRYVLDGLLGNETDLPVVAEVGEHARPAGLEVA